MNLNEVFPEIQKGVRGASSDDGLLWFFKGKTVWAYSNFELINGFPKNIKDSKYPSEPESAINIGGKFYLIRVKNKSKSKNLISFNCHLFKGKFCL